jgi:hypothetical protein
VAIKVGESYIHSESAAAATSGGRALRRDRERVIAHRPLLSFGGHNPDYTAGFTAFQRAITYATSESVALVAPW